MLIQSPSMENIKEQPVNTPLLCVTKHSSMVSVTDLNAVPETDELPPDDDDRPTEDEKSGISIFKKERGSFMTS